MVLLICIAINDGYERVKYLIQSRFGIHSCLVTGTAKCMSRVLVAVVSWLPDR